MILTMMEAKSGSKYERLRKIGIGSYGVVFKCINRQSGQVVAIKRYSENDSDPIIRKIAMREVRMLRQLKHPNLINLIEVFRRKRRLHLVFDYCELTVLDVIEKYTNNCPLNLIRKIIWQTVNAINYCHTHNCIHRDIKPENILINQSGVVKLCDFGFARSIKSSASPATTGTTTGNSIVYSNERSFLQARDSRIFNGDRLDQDTTITGTLNSSSSSDRQAFTEYVATRWYRAPELLIGEIYYDIKIDIWAIGCVTAELMRGEPIWPGKTDLDQLFTIKSSLGLLTQSQTHTLLSQGIYDQANIERLLEQTASSSDSLDKKLPRRVGQSGIDFVAACLQMDPLRRPTSVELLSHEYIYSARMAQFIQKDHAPTHRLPLLGDRTVTLPSLSPTINRTNSQALLLLTSSQQQQQQQQRQQQKQQQQQQQQQRPAKRFVAASLDSPNRKAPTHDAGLAGRTSSIPLAISTKQQQRSPMKQVKISGGGSSNKHKATLVDDQTGGAVPLKAAGGGGGGGGAGKQFKGKQSVKSNISNSNVNVSSLISSSPPSSASYKLQAGNPREQLANLDTAAQLNGRGSMLPVSKVRSRETSLQRTMGAALPSAGTNHHPHHHHHHRYDSTMTNTTATMDMPNGDKQKSFDPTYSRRIVQVQQQQQQQQQPKSSTAEALRQRIRQQANGYLPLNKGLNDGELLQGAMREGGEGGGKENSLGLLKAGSNKRKTTTNESSASSSNFSDSLGTVRSSSIAFIPSLYQDHRRANE